MKRRDPHAALRRERQFRANSGPFVDGAANGLTVAFLRL